MDIDQIEDALQFTPNIGITKINTNADTVAQMCTLPNFVTFFYSNPYSKVRNSDSTWLITPVT